MVPLDNNPSSRLNVFVPYASIFSLEFFFIMRRKDSLMLWKYNVEVAEAVPSVANALTFSGKIIAADLSIDLRSENVFDQIKQVLLTTPQQIQG
jgi:hypothetical protein